MDDKILPDEIRQELPETISQPPPPPKRGWFDWLAGHNFLIVGTILVLVLGVLAALWFMRNQREEGPQSANVLLSIKGPPSVPSGNESEFRVIYTNGENADLTNVSLEVFYPANFTFVSADHQPTAANGQRYNLPLLRQGQSQEVVIKGKLSGATNETKELRARLTFSLSNFSSQFSVDANYSATITAPALEMEITGPIDVNNGQATTFAVNYKNVSGAPYQALGLELQYPESFQFRSAVPEPAKDGNYWNLGALAADAEGRVEVTGVFVGDPGTESEISGDLGLALPSGLAPQIRASARFKIQASSLTVTQTAEPGDVAKLGQTIQFRLKYGNYGRVGQSNVVVSAVVEGASLDIGQLRSTDGIVTGNTVTWKSATVSKLSLLSPNQTGELAFSVPVRPAITTNLPNQTIKSTVTIYSDQNNSPIQGQAVELKLGTQIDMIVSGNYVSGALPMKVGESTAFDVTFLVSNLSNKLTGAELVASMPLPASAWADVVVPEQERANVTFDRNASKLRWRLGDIDPFVGKFSPVRSLTVRLTVLPSEADRGRNVTLFRDIVTTGMDAFTGKEVQSTQLRQLNVTDLGDDSIDYAGGSVQ